MIKSNIYKMNFVVNIYVTENKNIPIVIKCIVWFLPKLDNYTECKIKNKINDIMIIYIVWYTHKAINIHK